jgi:hypothetical protein
MTKKLRDIVESIGDIHRSASAKIRSLHPKFKPIADAVANQDMKTASSHWEKFQKEARSIKFGQAPPDHHSYSKDATGDTWSSPFSRIERTLKEYSSHHDLHRAFHEARGVVLPQHPHGDHLIYDKDMNFLHKVPVVPHDNNHGLPQSFFDHEHINIEHLPNGDLDWTSPMGPGPVWEDKHHKHDTPQTIGHRFNNWASKL